MDSRLSKRRSQAERGRLPASVRGTLTALITSILVACGDPGGDARPNPSLRDGREGNAPVVGTDDLVFAQLTVDPAAGARHTEPKTNRDTEPSDPPPAGAPVPEPTTMLLVGSGLVGAAWMRRRRSRFAAGLVRVDRA